MPAVHNTEDNKVAAYKYYNYAVLHTRGLSHVFDTMRYDGAFLARRADFDRIIEAVNDPLETLHSRRYSLLLCRYDWRGKTKPGWTPARLLSDQEYEEVSDPPTLLELGADRVDLRPTQSLKFESVVTLSGPIRWILGVMYDNRAFPAREPDAHDLEQAFHRTDEEITICLKTFRASEQPWTLPRIV